jgi:hypothetical protein
MRAQADSATIGVSCGHRVPREPELVDGRKLYWCATCGAHRMSGGATTGERAFDFLLELRDGIFSFEIPIVVDDPGTERGRAIVRALGASFREEHAAAIDDAQQFFLEAQERALRIEQGERRSLA